MSITVMPSAPKAEETATEFPNVSKAHCKTCLGLQPSAVNCAAVIQSFTRLAPVKTADSRPMASWLSKVRLRLRRDPPAPPPRLLQATWEQGVFVRSADRQQWSEELAGT